MTVPEQEAARFERVINARAAAAIGLAIPALFLAWADQVAG